MHNRTKRYSFNELVFIFYAKRYIFCCIKPISKLELGIDVISWDTVIDKKVKSSDDQDLGKVHTITKDFVQTKEGLVSKKYYFIPKYYVQGYDGENVWVSLTKNDVKAKFERDNAPSDLKSFLPEGYDEKRNATIKDNP